MKGKAHASIGLLTYYNYSLLTGNAPNMISAALSVFFSLLPDLDHYHSMISKKLSIPLIEQIFESIIMAVILFPILYIYKIKGQHYYIVFITIIFITAVIGVLIKKSIFRKLSITFAIMCSYVIFQNIFVDKKIVYFMIFMGILPWLSHRSFSHSITAMVALYLSLSPVLPSEILIPCILSYASHILYGDLLTPSGVPLFFPFSNKRYTLIHTTLKSKKIVPVVEFISILLLFSLAVYLFLLSV